MQPSHCSDFEQRWSHDNGDMFKFGSDRKTIGQFVRALKPSYDRRWRLSNRVIFVITSCDHRCHRAFSPYEDNTKEEVARWS